ncbi:hypothetical protein RN001_013333 [Aquatica leii]|uniref:Uncharacterized protein n=1 Tax=Aquatica leii TaxID=1421715 RepID=A0AAN7SLK1_9COLE|nr:hypothetical protein RN001_013333 [Aquatica leii]
MDKVNSNNYMTNNDKIKKKRTKSFQNYSNYLQQFCTSTSIHGFKFLGERNRYLIEKIWWFIVLVLASAGSSSLVYQSYNKWNTSPIVVTLAMAETPIWNVPFPAVTICPELKCNSRIFNFSNVHLKYTSNETISQEDETESCKWAGKELNCSSALEPIMTSEGLCDTFNMLQLSEIVELHVEKIFDDSKSNNTKARQWSLDKGYSINATLDTYPRRTTLPGVKSGFQIDLYVNDNDLDYTCREIQGFKVSLHHPGEIPDLVNYFRVPLDQVVVAAVKPNMITTSDDLVNYDPHIRQCYLPEEIKLKSFKMYTQRNCILECLSNYLLHKCGCTLIYMPHKNDSKFCGPGKMECINHYQAHLMDHRAKFQDERNTKKSKFYCGCLPLCTSLSFDAETSQTDWNWRKTYNLLQRNSTIDSFDYKSGHYSRLIVFYKEMQFMTSERHEVYGSMEFLANCGGLFGLFLGFSFTSFMEIVYFLSLRLFCNIKKFGRMLWSGVPPVQKQNVVKIKY